MLSIIRPIHILPGREAEAIQWLKDTEAERRKAGQVTQYVLQSVVDSANYVFVQVWESREAYASWRDSPERERLANERRRYLTHDPTHTYDVR
ncbi:MAG TPA: antibiotic biosynthesis monooxygenase [Chloroflexota bacterium]|nr:antibiotic biosynthesis monooxygenase [Chloroflexota bacterium]